MSQNSFFDYEEQNENEKKIATAAATDLDRNSNHLSDLLDEALKDRTSMHNNYSK
jgi:hypothetical protein